MQLKLFALHPSFEPERRVLVARPAAARLSSRLVTDAPRAQVPAVLVRLPESRPQESLTIEQGVHSAASGEMGRDARAAKDPEAEQVERLVSKLIARKEHGLYGAAHPFVQQLWRARQTLEEVL